MPEIFINYRRADTMESGGHLYSDLCRTFGDSAVFMDTRGRNIPWGADWDRALKDGLDNCQVLVALIGPHWEICERSPGKRALDEPDDWVRTEIATALRQSKKIFPVLIGRTTPPAETALPAELRELGFLGRQAYPISEDRWDDEARYLVTALNGLPKLKQLYDFKIGGIRLLENLIRENNIVADAVSRSRVVIETAFREVNEIKLLKNIHDALHEIESKSFIPIRDELLQRVPNAQDGQTCTVNAFASAKRKFDQQVRDINALRGELATTLPSLNVLLDIDLPQQLNAATMAFDRAARMQRPLDFNRLVGSLEELGGYIPTRLNDAIDDAVGQLELQKLLDQMTIISGGIDPVAAATRELSPMFDSIAALKDRPRGLTLRVRDHTLLQGLDNTLRRMFGGQFRPGTWKDADDEDVSVSWNEIKRQRENFIAPFSPVLEDREPDLKDLEAGIVDAVDRHDKVDTILALLYRYANEVGDLFRKLDAELKEFCADLRERTQPVKAVLQQIGPERQHV
jgi:hypothetical protein